MLRSWFLPALAAGLIIPAIARADDPVPPKSSLDRLEAAVKKLDEKVTTAQNDIISLSEKLRKLEAKSASANDLIDVSSAIADLRKDIERLRQDLVRTSAKPAPNGYQQMPGYPTIPGTQTGPTESLRVANGTLRLINEFAFPQEVVVNGQTVPLDPGQTADVNVPAGVFSFQVLSKDLTPRIRQLAAGTVYTVRIR